MPRRARFGLGVVGPGSAAIAIGLGLAHGCVLAGYDLGGYEVDGGRTAAASGSGGAGTGGATASAGGGATASTGSGGGDCSDCRTDVACQTHSCEDGMCTVYNWPDGFPIGPQHLGDCETIVCDGRGGTKGIPDGADPPTVGADTPCRKNVCAQTDAGLQVKEEVYAGADCSGVLQGCCAGGHCLANSCMFGGSTTECDAPKPCWRVDCAPAAECNNTSACTYTVDLTKMPPDSPDDCLMPICDGSGQIVLEADDTDTPGDDGDPCTEEKCVAGTAHPPAPDGTPCMTTGQCIAGTCMTD